MTFAIESAARGEPAVIFAFDEGRGTIDARARTLRLPLQEVIGCCFIVPSGLLNDVGLNAHRN